MSVGILQQNIGPNLGFYPGNGYTSTTAPRTHASARSHRGDTVVISALNLKHLTQEIDGAGVEEKLRAMQKADRDRRHTLSKNRISSWDNTVLGLRRRRLQARTDRIDADEQDRLAVDRAYAAKERARRQECIERAKRLQYAETDLVKQFHSKVVLFETLRERDMQLEMKKHVAGAEKAIDMTFFHAAAAEIARGNAKDMQAEIEKRKRGVLVQNVQLQQAQEKRAREAREAEQNDTLENTLITSSHFASAEATLPRKRAQQAAFRAQLARQQHDAATRAATAEQVELHRAQAADSWVARKRLQVAKKKELELEHKARASKRKQQSGEESARKAQAAEARVDAQVRKAMADRDERESALQRREAAKRWKQGEDIAESYRDHLVREEAARKEREVEEAATLRNYLAVEAATAAERRAKAEEVLQKGKDLQEHHLRDIAQHAIKRESAAQASMLEAARAAQKQASEITDLHAYMRGLANEPWAKPNTRLQLFVDAETAEKVITTAGGPASSSSSAGDHRGWVDTGRRLGFGSRQSQQQQQQQQQMQQDRDGVVVVRPSTVAGGGPASRPQSCARLVRGETTLPGRVSASNSRPGSSGKGGDDGGIIGSGLGVMGLPALPTRA
ncbi:hypothetical protein HDU87_001563 [Geranomyces variabilis]|uniref:Trichohyalin-plectin-homology domain-containing protein n=1 Tax=Geranomyces variabilis TaxID=109894 RepID=A0AAD5TN57_9FUNG|nr:hypothetical protein HDU87_001563 [Geranomyces variabilis]